MHQTDLEVDRVPSVRAWLVRAGFMHRVEEHYHRAHRARIYALDDLFVVKYDASGSSQLGTAGGAAVRAAAGQRGLSEHVDAGDISFMVAPPAAGVRTSLRWT
eukprot:COSAG01_NODE_17403_length_1154_cov_1.830332_2_plen_103_part_00